MFAPYCTFHGSRVLLDLDAIEGLRTQRDGITVCFTCTCGTRGQSFIRRSRSAPLL